MAIQAQLYPESTGFSIFGSQHLIMTMDSQHKVQEQEQEQEQELLVQLEIKNLQQQQQNKRFRFDSRTNNDTTYRTAHQTMTYGQNITAQVENQRQEIDHYIELQNERLRLILQEQRKQQFSMLLKKIEAKTIELMRQKDEEIAQTTNRTRELEYFLRKLEMENQTWKTVAQEHEAMIVSLNNTLEQVRERACCINNVAEDADSCCDVGRENDEEIENEKTGENRIMGNDDIVEQQGKKITMACRVCNFRSSCMLLLPCRHLCSCEACEAYLDYCPVCKTAKKFSMEALI